MEKKELPEPHPQSCLADSIRILTLGSLEGKKQNNIQRGKENKVEIWIMKVQNIREIILAEN